MADTTPAQFFQVEICYATPDLQLREPVYVAAGATIQQAIMQSGLLRAYSAIDLTVCRVGIYGKRKPLDTILREHDRIEIYRPLIAGPMDARRRRAAKKEA